jgi:hypothetical protein
MTMVSCQSILYDPSFAAGAAYRVPASRGAVPALASPAILWLKQSPVLHGTISGSAASHLFRVSSDAT